MGTLIQQVLFLFLAFEKWLHLYTPMKGEDYI